MTYTSPFFVQPHIDAAVVAQLEGAIGGERGVLKFFRGLLVEVFGRRGFCHLVGLGLVIELHVLAGDPRRSLGKLGEVEFNQRQHLGIIVAENGGVDFAAFNVLLNERRAVEFLVDVVDALHQLFHAVDDGAVVDADGSIFGDRLHDQRKLDIVRVIGAAFIGEWRSPGS